MYRFIVLSFSFLILSLGISFSQSCLNGGTPGPNLIVNGDFSSGNVSFNSDYIYCNTANCLQPEGTCAVGTNANFFHTAFTGTDHTTGTGNFMIVNGSINNGFKVWEQTVTVTPNTDYQFDFWLLSCVTGSPAQLIVRINGVQINPGTINAPSVLNTWIQSQTAWNSGAATSANIVIINQNVAPAGNDFGIDDIEFYACTVCTLPVQSIADTIICQGEPVKLSTTAPPGVSYSWNPNYNLTSPTVSSPTATPAATTFYTVTVTDANGCMGRDTVVIIVQQPPLVSKPTPPQVCVGDSALLALGFTGQPTWVWSPANTLTCTTCPNPKAFPSSNTYYTFTVTGANGCSRTDSILVKVAQAPTVDAGNDVFLCNTQMKQLSGSYIDTAVMQSYQWTPTQGLLPPNVLNPFANPTTTTTYTLAVTNIHGCTGYDSVTAHRSSVTVDAGPDFQVCPGQPVQLQGSVSGSVASFSWTPNTGLSNANTLTPTLVNPTGSVTLTLLVTDNSGCTASDDVTVTANTPPNMVVSADTGICEGATVTLNASGATNYSWAPAANLSCSNCPNPVTTPTNTTTYTVIGTDGNGCGDTLETTVTVHPSPTASASADDSLCVGQSKVLQASGGGSYTWKPGGSLSCTNCPNPTASPVLNTIYTVVVSTPFGCKDSTTTTLFVASGPPLTVSPDATICPGDAVNMQVSGASSYNWSPAGSLSCSTCTNPVATPVATTTYTVVGNSSLGCGSADTVKVTVRTPVQATVTGDTVICTGGSKSWLAQGLQSYQWSPAAGLNCTNCPNPQVNPASTTTYTLTGTDANGCAALPTTRTMYIRSLPAISITGPDTLCAGEVAALTGNGGQTYSWNPSTGLSCSSCRNPSVILSQARTYQVTGTDAFGCVNTDTHRIEVIPQPVVTLTSDGSICEGDSYALSATGGGTYQWQGAGLSCYNCPNPTASPTQTTKYFVTVTNAANCRTVDSVTVTVNPTPNLTVSADTGICVGASAQLQVTGTNTFTWSPSSSLSCANCPNPIATPISTTTYSITGTSASGCAATDSVEVEVYPLPNIQLTPDTTICRNTTAQLSAGGGIQYTWTPPATLSDPNISNPVASPSQTTTYNVVVTDANGCFQSSSVVVTVADPLPPNARPDTIICPGELVQLFTQNGASFSWQPTGGLDDPASGNPMAQPTQSTWYTVSMVDINGCDSRDSVYVELYPAPNPSAGQDVTIYEGQPVTLGGSGGTSYMWRPGAGMTDSTSATPRLILNDTTTFTLTVTDANGCEGTDQVTVFVIEIPEIYVPTAFSPNGDGKNDVFRIPFSGGIELSQFAVYDRWGSLMFLTQDPTNGWDGTLNDEPQPMGTYIFIVQGVHSDGSSFNKKGNVTLLR